MAPTSKPLSRRSRMAGWTKQTVLRECEISDELFIDRGSCPVLFLFAILFGALGICGQPGTYGFRANIDEDPTKMLKSLKENGDEFWQLIEESWDMTSSGGYNYGVGFVLAPWLASMSLRPSIQASDSESV